MQSLPTIACRMRIQAWGTRRVVHFCIMIGGLGLWHLASVYLKGVCNRAYSATLLEWTSLEGIFSIVNTLWVTFSHVFMSLYATHSLKLLCVFCEIHCCTHVHINSGATMEDGVIALMQCVGSVPGPAATTLAACPPAQGVLPGRWWTLSTWSGATGHLGGEVPCVD